MKNIGIIIQARTNSKRLKGKILKKLGDKPLIEWVIKRLKKTKVNNIILATSKNSKDLELRDICIKEKISFFNGSEKNVLERFYQAAKQYKLDAIIRVCADNPFVDSEEINLLINKFKSNNFEDDYYFNHRNYEQNRYADGFGAELFKFSTLEHLYKNPHQSFWPLLQLDQSQLNICPKSLYIVFCVFHNDFLSVGHR